MTNSFDVRVRRMPEERVSSQFRVRVAVLPRRLDDAGGHIPWSRAVPQTAPAPVDLNRTAADQAALWLPPARTKLVLPNAVAELDSMLQRLWLDESGGTLIPKFRTGDAGGNATPQAEIVCFGGLKELDEQEQKSIGAVRNSKEFLLYLIEAFRFDGTLIDYARLGDAQLMACLSHLIFEIHGPTNAGLPELLLAEGNWNRDIRVTYEGDPEALGRSETDSAFGVDPLDFKVRCLLPPAQNASGEAKSLVIQTEQKADGVFMRILNVQDFEKKDAPGEPNDELKLRLRRAVGVIPSGFPPVVATSYYGLKEVQMRERADSEGGIRHLYAADREFHIADQMEAADFAEKQLHYLLEMVDGFGQVAASTSKTLLRERFDPPPAPVEAMAWLQPPMLKEAEPLTEESEWSVCVELRFQNALLDVLPLASENPGEWNKQIQKDFPLELFVQERPLDECGFYGDDDDNALLEGLAQADALYDPRASGALDAKIPGRALERHMRGSFDRQGLLAIPIEAGEVQWTFERIEPTEAEKKQGQKPREYAVLRWTKTFPDKEPPTWLRKGNGYHFHACVARKLTAETLKGTLSACKHELRFVKEKSPNPVQTSVFQIELFPINRLEERELSLTRRFLARKKFELSLLEPQVDPDHPGQWIFKRQPSPARLRPASKDSLPVPVDVLFSFPAANHPDFKKAVVDANGKATDNREPIGGVRVLVRDRVAKEPELPFRVAETIQVLPQVVTFYRPVQIESGIKVVAVAKNYEGPLLQPQGLNAPEPNDAPAATDPGHNIWAFGKGGVADTLRTRLREATKVAFHPDIFRERATDTAAGETPGEEPAGTGIFEGSAEEINQLAKGWLETKFNALTAAANDTVFASEAGATGRAAQENLWPMMGALLALLRELGLVQDFVVRLQEMSKAADAIREAAENLAQSGYQFKVIALQSAEGDPMGTVRVVALPWDTGSGTSLLDLILAGKENSAISKAYQACVEAKRLLWYRDATRAPLNLTLRAGRLVRYRWQGLRDFWHHDLEFAIQLLDRYQYIRDRYLQAGVAAKGVESEAGDLPAAERAELERTQEEARREALRERKEALVTELEDHLYLHSNLVETGVDTIVVPRLEPLLAPPGAFPASNRPPHVLAFEILDTDEGQKAAHNVLARARPGNLILHQELRADFPEQPLYFNGALEWCQTQISATQTFKTWWIASLKQAGEQFESAPEFALPHSEPAGSGEQFNFARRDRELPFLRWDLRPPATEEVRDSVPPRGQSGVATYHHKAHYLRYQLGCHYSADYLKSPAASTTAEREPRHLALPFVPKFYLSPVGDGGSEKVMLTVDLTPGLLGSHATVAEIKEETGQVIWVNQVPPGLALDNPQLGAVPDGQRLGDIPLLLLPDLWLEYTFFLEMGGNKRLPIFEWKAPRSGSGIDAGLLKELGNAGTGGTHTPLGFTCRNVSSLCEMPQAKWLLDETVSQSQAIVQFRATLTFADSNAAAAALEANQVWMTLRRKALATDLLKLNPSEVLTP